MMLQRLCMTQNSKHPSKILATLLIGTLLVVGFHDVQGETIAVQANANGILSEAKQPNILLIVADDLGYTDMGAFGGEIDTPNLDRLARKGVRLSSFYTAPTCSPTRSSLLSGVDHHRAGLGAMAETIQENQIGHPGYEGYLNHRVLPLPQALSEAGYNTYMTGKWHLGYEPDQTPKARGFKRSFVLLNGGAGHFDKLSINGHDKIQFNEDGKSVEKLPDNFYSSITYTDRMINFIKSDEKSEKPFFTYLAFTAPHWPLQAPRKTIEKYAGKYSMGFDELQKQRLARSRQEGLVSDKAVLGPSLPGEKTWTELGEQEKAISQRKMEVYAAMVDEMDKNVGRLIDYLEQNGELDNTIIFFMSDNGGEAHDDIWGMAKYGEWAASCCDNRLENIGNGNSYVWVGPSWTRASIASRKYYKSFTSEGGINTPAFILYPGQQNGGAIDHRFVSVTDVMPTLLAMVGIDAPTVAGESSEYLTMDGSNFLNRDEPVDHGWELRGRPAYRFGDWKIIRLRSPLGNDKWQLYNVVEDPTETNDLAAQYPEKLAELVAKWEAYSKRNGVILRQNVSVL